MDIKVNRKAFCSYTFKGREREISHILPNKKGKVITINHVKITVFLSFNGFWVMVVLSSNFIK